MNEKCKGCRWQRVGGCVVQGRDDNPWEDAPCEGAWLLCNGDDYEPLIPADYKAAVDKVMAAAKNVKVAVGFVYYNSSPMPQSLRNTLLYLSDALAELEKVTK
jgi:hypothetical protein